MIMMNGHRNWDKKTINIIFILSNQIINDLLNWFLSVVCRIDRYVTAIDKKKNK